MAKEPWFKFWSAEYLTDPDVDAIPLESQGLLVRMWSVCNIRGSIPADVEEIARLTNVRLSCVSQCVSHCVPFFDLRDDQLFSLRLEREKAKSEAARQSAQVRHNKTTSANRIANCDANRIAKVDANRIAKKAREQEYKKELKPLQPPSTEPADSGIDNTLDPAPRKPGAERQADPRFKPAVDSINRYWNFKNPETPFIWDNSEGEQLRRLLKATPQLSIEQITECLRHRARSDVVHTDRPRKWLANLLSFAAGPLNKYGKPLGTEHASNRAEQNEKQSIDAIESAARKFIARRLGREDSGAVVLGADPVQQEADGEGS